MRAVLQEYEQRHLSRRLVSIYSKGRAIITLTLNLRAPIKGGSQLTGHKQVHQGYNEVGPMAFKSDDIHKNDNNFSTE